MDGVSVAKSPRGRSGSLPDSGLRATTTSSRVHRDQVCVLVSESQIRRGRRDSVRDSAGQHRRRRRRSTAGAMGTSLSDHVRWARANRATGCCPGCDCAVRDADAPLLLSRSGSGRWFIHRFLWYGGRGRSSHRDSRRSMPRVRRRGAEDSAGLPAVPQRVDLVPRPVGQGAMQQRG